MSFFKTIVKLFPRSKAFQAFVDTSFRRFVQGLAVVPDDERKKLDLVYADIFPDTTREVARWEKQFGIIFTTGYSMAIRRNLLDSFWKINRGGQSNTYLQSLLQNIDSRIRVVENVPVRNLIVNDVVLASVDNNEMMCDGGETAVDNYYLGDSDFVPTILRNSTEQPYSVPADKEHWAMCFYVCGGALYDNREIIYIRRIEVSAKWQKFIEYIVLKTKPVHTTATMFIKYTEETDD